MRGGHNFFRVRVADYGIGALSESLDVLITIDQSTFDIPSGEVKIDCIVIFDPDKVKLGAGKLNSLGIPLEKLAEKNAGKKPDKFKS